MALKAGVGLKLFTADTTSLVMYVWFENFVVIELINRLEVFVALVAVVVRVIVSLVSLHVLFGPEL